VWYCSITPTLKAIFSHGMTAPSGAGPPHCWGFTITLRHPILVSTPLDKWSPWQRELPDNTWHSQHRHPCPARFEPAILASRQLQLHTLDRAATGISSLRNTLEINVVSEIFNQLHGAELFSKIGSYCFGKFSALMEPNFCYHWILCMFYAVR
jgi:hypothetical protein